MPGNKAFKNGNDKEALRRYAESIKLAAHPFTYSNMALVKLKHKDWAGAVQDAGSATTLEPHHGCATNPITKQKKLSKACRTTSFKGQQHA